MTRSIYIHGGGSRSEPMSETALATWMEQAGVTNYEMARRVGCDPSQMQKWRRGQSLPGLIYAFKIDRETRGAVPPSSWLGTDLGRRAWEIKGLDWENFKRAKNATAAEAHRKERVAKKAARK